MATNTHNHPNLAGLDDDAVDQLNDLISLNIDSAKGFAQAAESVDVAAYASLFRDLGRQRQNNADELRREVLADGEEPTDSGSSKGTAHRWWMNLRDKITTSEAYDVLAEAERGEDVIKERYEEVLKSTTDHGLNGVVQRQYTNVKAGHDRIRDLRDKEHARA